MDKNIMDRLSPEELNDLRCYASEIARRLWINRDKDQLYMLKLYVDRYLEEVEKIKSEEPK